MNSKLKYFLSYIIILISNLLLAQTTLPKKYPSLLWEITGNGISKPSYLYGTMHVSNKLVFNLQDTFFIGLKSVEVVALELNMNEWMNDIMLKQEARSNKNTRNYAKVNGFYSNAFDIDIPKKEDLISILQFKPSISQQLMYRNSSENSDYQENMYLDAFIFQAGTKLNKKVVGLENYKQTEELSIKSEQYIDDEDDKNDIKEQKKIRLKELKGDKSYYEMLEDCYRKGDLDLLDSLHKLSSEDGYLKYMLYERNKIMANRMDSIIKKSSLFTGVGAAHLAGDNGVINLLRKMGYKLRPITSSISDTKTKNQIDETRFPTKMITQYASDSLFSISVPGKLSEVIQTGSSRYYLFNDMQNGSYYCVQRMNHYGKLLGKTQEQILKSIDSLIFENIPGKLLSKKEMLLPNGFPCIEINNKTAKGDIEKHKIIITPLEIISFKMSGIQEYLNKGTETDAFFNSITFKESKESTEYISKFGYQLTLPVTKNITQVSANSNNSYQNEIINGFNKTTNNYSLFLSASLFDFDYLEEDTFELNMLAERFCLQTNKQLISRQFIFKNNSTSLFFILKSKNKEEQKYTAQITILGPNYYILVSNQDSLESLTFFNSFKKIKPLYKVPFSNIYDTTLLFSSKAQVLTNIYSDLFEKESNYYGLKSSKKAKAEKSKNVYLPSKETKIYISPETREKVFVEFRKFSMYYQLESMDKFWKSRLNFYTDNDKLKLSRLTKTKENNSNVYSFMLSDTACSRGIWVKTFQRCGTIYTLKTVIDTIDGLTEFSKKFIESFVPKDSCIGLDITSNKLDPYFFNKLYSADTTESKKAKAALEYVQANMLANNVPNLMNAINHKDFNTLSSLQKKNLIYCFIEPKTKESIVFLENLYDKYADSVDIEITILNTLARFKNAESIKSILKLLKIDVPITTNEFSLNNIFNNLSDSVENSKLLFPEILKYTKYNEYKNSIYTLMVKIFESKNIKAKSYSSFTNDILLDANYELKKYISEKERDKEAYRYSSPNTKVESVYESLNFKQQKVYNFATLLAPFYKNSDIKKFYTKLLASSTSDKFKSILYGKLIINDIIIEDSIVTKYSSNLSSRVPFYKILKQENKLNVFDEKYLNQKDLVIADLYGNSESIKKDTIVFLFVNKVEFNKKSGNVYVFKSKQKDKKVWKLGYTAVHPLEKNELSFNPKFTKTNFSYESDAQLKKEINSLMHKIRIYNRKRASINDFEIEDNHSYGLYN